MQALAMSASVTSYVVGPLPVRRVSRKTTNRRTSLRTVAAVATDSNLDKAMPDWTGEKLLSRVVNAAISFPPLFAVMKAGARTVMKSTAEQRGIGWGSTVAELEQSEVVQIKEEVEVKGIPYPWYYTVPFHGYDTGNLSWLAAFEVEPATQVMALRVWKTELDLDPATAQARLRRSILDAAREFMQQHGVASPKDMIDIGCATGISTRWLAEEFPAAAVTGLDLSPYFLAVAELRERQAGGGGGSRQRVRYIHADMEHSGLPDGSFDLVSIQFVMHELPGEIITNLVHEAKRLLRPGGLLMFADNNPRSKVIQGLPPVLYTLMKSTEPHSDSYYAFDLEGAMRDAGFQHVITRETDPRHRTVLGHL